MLVDREAGKVVEVLLFETEKDLRQGDETMTRMRHGKARCTAFQWNTWTFLCGSNGTA
jgi:hypothetical protein